MLTFASSARRERLVDAQKPAIEKSQEDNQDGSFGSAALLAEDDVVAYYKALQDAQELTGHNDP
jgi:hypothetical protein